jgi:hypothetical protein
MEGVWTRHRPRSVGSIKHQILQFNFFALQQLRMPGPPVQVHDLPPQVGEEGVEIPVDLNELVREVGPGFADLIVTPLAHAQELGHVPNQQQQAACEKLEKLADEASEYLETDPPPLHLCCPISMGPFTDAVVTPTGQTYNRHTLKKWVDKNGTCPKTNQWIAGDAWYPNYEKNSDYEDWAKNLLARKRTRSEDDDNGSSGRERAQRIDKD